MARQQCSGEQIIHKLRAVEVVHFKSTVFNQVWKPQRLGVFSEIFPRVP